MYHLALIRGTGKVKCWANGHNASTVVLEARHGKDYLSTDIWRYIGPRETTKRHLHQHKAEILMWINKTYDTSFTHLIID